MFSFFNKKAKTPETLINELGTVGLGFNSEKAMQTFTEEVADFEADGLSQFEFALCIMGDEQYDSDNDKVLPWLSNDVWHFDFEAVEDHGSYIDIVKNCIRLSKSAIKISKLKDYVDIEQGVAKVTFHSLSKEYVFDLEVDNDWADPNLFSKLNDLLNEAGSHKKFCKHDFGQDCLIVCKSRDEIKSINSATGLQFSEFRN